MYILKGKYLLNIREWFETSNMDNSVFDYNIYL